MTDEEKSCLLYGLEDDGDYISIFKEMIDVKDEIEKYKRIADNERERIRTWEEAYTEGLKNKWVFLENKILSKFKEDFERDPKTKINTPYGKITKRTTTKYFYEKTDAEIIEQLKDIKPELVKTTVEESYNKADLKKVAEVTESGAVCIDGEIIDGITASKVTDMKVEVLN